MRLFKCIVLSIVFTALLGLAAGYEDKPCAARPIFNRSVVCVCDVTYCDTIHRLEPAPGAFVTYVSSESGSRFNKSEYFVKAFDISSTFSTILKLDPTTKYQTINGFGGAITDAAAINWDSLRDPMLKQHLIESYCGNSGIQYNMLRVPIGGTDFSTSEYAYNELPENDIELKNFTLAPEDYNYKLPMIKACMEAASTGIDIIAATWSPPKWMKDTYENYGVCFLKKEYYQTYVEYHRKFIEEYRKQGVNIWGISTTNEPINGALNTTAFNRLGWTVPNMAEWIADYLGPSMEKYYPEVKILGGDDQRYALPIWLNDVALFRSDAVQFLDGMAVHFYRDDYSPPSLLTLPLKDYPDLFVIATEACGGAFDDIKVDLGSWDRAEMYARDILEDLNYNVIGWLDWNMCLNEEGGPNWTNSSVDSPVIVKPDEGVFYKQPMFYAMGHFSKFVPRGSRRILSVDSSSSLNHVAMLTPENNVVVVALNEEKNEREVTITLGDRQARVVLEPKSITTLEFSKDW